MSITPGSNKPSNIKTPTPVKYENAPRENRNESENQEKASKDSSKSDMRFGKSQKAKWTWLSQHG